MCLRSVALRFVAAIAVIGALAGCSTTEALRGLPPFFENAYDESSDTTDVVIRPLFRYRDQPDRREGADRGERSDLHYLFPLGHLKERTGDTEHHLWPIFQWITHKDREGRNELNYLFFPFVWGGSRPGEGGYFTLWPFGGTFRHLFGKDYIVHVLFPLFAYTRLHDFESYHFLFPFFAYQTGDGNEGFRILPFYGHQRLERDGALISDRYSVLFPLFAWEKDNVNTRNPFTAFAIFPLYGQTRSNLVDETTVLWPFFRKREEKKDGITRWRVPFPIAMIATGNETQYDFWPLVGYRRNGGFTRVFALWPLIRMERHVKEKVVESRRWLVPFFWNFERKARDTGEIVYAQRKVWPLLRVDRTEGGGFGFRAPSILWFKDSPEENFETILTPLTELVRYRDDPKRGKELRLLFSLFLARWGHGGDEDGWSFLGGLVGHRTTREGEGRVRLLYFIEL